MNQIIINYHICKNNSSMCCSVQIFLFQSHHISNRETYTQLFSIVLSTQIHGILKTYGSPCTLTRSDVALWKRYIVYTCRLFVITWTSQSKIKYQDSFCGSLRWCNTLSCNPVQCVFLVNIQDSEWPRLAEDWIKITSCFVWQKIY